MDPSTFHPGHSIFRIPHRIGPWQDPEHYVDFVRVRGSTLFAGGPSQGFGIYDLRNPGHPSLLGSLGGADMVRSSSMAFDGLRISIRNWS